MAERMSAAQPPGPLRIGTRGSALALRQTQIVVDALQRIAPSVECSVEVIRTQGDENTAIELSQFESQGVFVRRIEAALLANEIDLAVHSFKDMPSISPEWLAIAAFLPREDPRDGLVARDGLTLAALPAGARVGTGSPRRQALLRAGRPDLDIQPLRGNVDTRLRRVVEGAYDAVVLAAAGLARLGREGELTERLDPTVFVPAVGQGIIAVQARRSDATTLELLQQIDDPETRTCAAAEREVAIAISAGCQTPFGAYARVENGQLRLSSFLATGERSHIVRAAQVGDPLRAADLGASVGAQLVATAASEVA
jgi:hydroxymethylbilane synthase